ncbi:unnamed protein product [Withania somnifera]
MAASASASASSRRFTAPVGAVKLRRNDILPAFRSGFVEFRRKKRKLISVGSTGGVLSVKCCSDSAMPIRGSSGDSGNGVDKSDDWRFDAKNINANYMRIQASSTMPFASHQSRFVSKSEKFFSRCTPRNSGPQSHDSPPKRDTGIANEKDWGISMLNHNVNETGINEDGSTWYRESGEDLGDNGYRCRWTRMGGQSSDGALEWKETWWEKSDWTGYKELGVEKSGKNVEGDAWWETWREVLHQDEWSNLARIERSAQKQAKSGTENAGWYENWWEKYDAKGWTEKGAHKYGRLNEQSWWEKWGEHYDGRGSVLKWMVQEMGEEHFGNGKVHKYGKSTTGESWDIVVDEGTYYEAEPHYGWADVVGNSTQLLSIQPRERPPGVFPNMDFGPPLPPEDELPPTLSQ